MEEETSQPLVFVIVAAEESGDRIGASLINSIKSQYPNAVFYGVAGEKMQAEGAIAWYSIKDFSVMGFIDVLKNYRKLSGYIKKIIALSKSINPDYFIGIDAPDLNFRFHKPFKQAGIKNIQYVSPQLWAWRKSRVNFVRQYIDMTLCLFPFEHNFYHKNNIRSLLVGHPLVANIKKEIQTGVSRDNTLDSIALMPGSRSHEIKYHLPIMIDIANVVSRKKSNISFKFILPNDFWGKKVEAMIKAYQIEFNYLIYTNNQYRQLSESKLAIIASGTAALESALLGVPTAVIYKTHWLNYLIFSLFGVTKREFYSLPNIIFQREYFKEFIGMTINKAQLKSHIFELLNLNKNNISSFKDGQSYLLNTLSPIDEKLIVKAILDL